MISQIKSYLILKFNKGRFRPILAIIFSLISSIKHFHIYLIYYDTNSGFWIHKRGKEIISIDDFPNFSFSYKRIRKTTLNEFFQHYTPENDDVIIDLGAGIGNDIFVINKYFEQKCRLYAIEAHPKTFKKLKLMTKMNNFTNVICSNYAIVESQQKIFINDTDNHSSNRLNNEGSGYEIDGISMDAFIEEQNLSKIDFLKINIEGAERGALSGMKKNIRNVSHIVVACHDKLASYYNDEPFFLTRDFVFNYLLEHEFTIDAEIETKYHITFHAHRN